MTNPPPRTLVIAEAGVNHDGSLERALALVDLAADAGADVVKFQTFRAADLVTRDAPRAEYQVAATGSSASQYEMLRELEIDAEAHRRLQARCRERGIEFLSTPFDPGSLSFLVDELGVARLKLGSGELTNGPLLLAAARTGRPLLLSTGMATLEEVRGALAVLAFGYAKREQPPSPAAFAEVLASREGRASLRERVTLLHCTTQYPTPYSEANLRAMDVLREAFDMPVGLSDHTLGISVPLAAVARGAVAVEKHFTTDRRLPGPDHAASLEPAELRAMIEGIRQVEQALGDGRKRPQPSEEGNRAVARKFLVAARPIRKGEPFDAANLTAKRSGRGLSPMEFWTAQGRPAPRDFAPDEPIEL